MFSIVAGILWLFYLHQLTTAQQCVVNNFQVQPNFDMSKMVGTWYEIKWIAEGFSDADLFTDYQHIYALETSNKLSVEGRGRFPEAAKRAGQCLYYKAKIERTNVTSDPAKLAYTLPNNVDNKPGTVTLPYWIMETDYVNYAVAYSCSKTMANGTCVHSKTDSWVWARKSRLTSAQTVAVDNVLSRVCLTNDRFEETPQNGQVCPTQGTSTLLPGGSLLIILALLTSLGSIASPE